MRLKLLSSLLFILSFENGLSNVPRISHESHHLGKVNEIYLHYGRVSLIDFPCVITKTATGPTGELGVKVGSSQKNELDIWLKKSSKKSTNLIVRCEEMVFVFDIIPSKSNHQDYVKIDTGFGTLLSSDSENLEVSQVDFEKELRVSAALKGIETQDEGLNEKALRLLFGENEPSKKAAKNAK